MGTAELSVALICESLARITYGYSSIRDLYSDDAEWIITIHKFITEKRPDLSEYAANVAVEITQDMSVVTNRIQDFLKKLSYTTEALFVLYENVWDGNPEVSFPSKLDSKLVSDPIGVLQDTKHDLVVLPEYKEIIAYFADEPETAEYFRELPRRISDFVSEADKIDIMVVDLVKKISKSLKV